MYECQLIMIYNWFKTRILSKGHHWPGNSRWISVCRFDIGIQEYERLIDNASGRWFFLCLNADWFALEVTFLKESPSQGSRYNYRIPYVVVQTGVGVGKIFLFSLEVNVGVKSDGIAGSISCWPHESQRGRLALNNFQVGAVRIARHVFHISHFLCIVMWMFVQ